MKKKPTYFGRKVFASEMLGKYFSQVPNNVISDIGAGYGNMKAPIEELGAIWQPFDYYKKMDFSVIWDLNNPCSVGFEKPGVVLFLEVLEHLANPLLGIQHIAEHMEKDGILILTTPNPQSSKNRLNLLLKGSLYAFQEKHLKEHHVFTPWEHIVKFYLESSGFEILEYAIVDTAYINKKPSTVKGFIKYYIERFIEYKYPKSKGMSYGIVARKK